MIYDCFQFFNELVLLKLRLKVLDSVVDHFVISESTMTHSGIPKKLYYNENKQLFKDFQHKIIHTIVTDSPNETSTSSFDRDGHEKGARSRGIAKCNLDDIIMYSDLDEIPNPEMIKNIIDKFDDTKVYNFAQRQFYFYINLEEVSGKLLSFAGDYDYVDKKQWLGTFMFSYRLFKHENIGVIRCDKKLDTSERVDEGGWHFTYMGGNKNASVVDRVTQKIKSYSHQEFNNEKVLSNIEKNIRKKRDIFGRSSKFKIVKIDDTYPKHLIDNILEYEYLVLPSKNIFSWLKK